MLSSDRVHLHSSVSLVSKSSLLQPDSGPAWRVAEDRPRFPTAHHADRCLWRRGQSVLARRAQRARADHVLHGVQPDDGVVCSRPYTHCRGEPHCPNLSMNCFSCCCCFFVIIFFFFFAFLPRPVNELFFLFFVCLFFLFAFLPKPVNELFFLFFSFFLFWIILLLLLFYLSA